MREAATGIAIDARDLYKRMLLIRRFEEAAYRAYEQGLIPGTVHASIGQEAVAVGVIAALNEDDTVLSHHRAHGHALAKGVDPRRMMAELFGRETGISAGKGGSMHLTDVASGFLGSMAIVGSAATLATGVALAHQIEASGRLAVAFFGDGAINQGVLYESFNLSSIWSLPVVYVCENNGYAISVPSEYSVGGPGLGARALAFGLDARSVDGQDVLAVHKAALELAASARSGRPGVLECLTYRFMGHSRGDPPHGLYRSRAEVEEWRHRDPLQLLASAAQLDDPTLAAAETEVAATISTALEFATSSAVPDREQAGRDVWG